MEQKRFVEDKLGYSLEELAAASATQPTRVFMVTYATTGKLLVIGVPLSDSSLCFDGLYCPFREVTLLIERAVATDWGLMSLVEN